MEISSLNGEPLLPNKFEALEKFEDWILFSESERNKKRVTSDYEEIKSFYNAMIEHSDEWVRHLNRFNLANMPPPEQRLYILSLSLMEVAPAVEFFQSPDLKQAVPVERLVIMSPSYDLPQWGDPPN